MKAIINGRLIVPDETGTFCIKENQTLIFSERIMNIQPATKPLPENVDEIIDATGAFVAPGFLNVHIHGCAGADTMDGTVEALQKISGFQAQTGVTAICPTTMTNPWTKIEQALVAIREAKKEEPVGARILGAHLEGPFVSRECCGSQPAEYIRKADFSLIKDYAADIKIVTIAPEETEGREFYAECHEAGIIVSLGHSAADYETALQAINEKGITHITHLCNGMKPLHHRKPGIVGAALDSMVACEVIADNIHVHSFMQRLIYREKGGQQIILITDSLRACGLGDGVSELGGQKVIVKKDLAVLEDGTIAGSVATMNRCVANFIANTGCRMTEAVEFATKVPAENLGIYDKLGSLAVGKLADITIFDEQLNIFHTIVGGRQVFIRKI